MIALDIAMDLGPVSLSASLQTQARRVAIVGPSGFGKSSLLRIILGLEPNATGSVSLDGAKLQGDGQRVPIWERKLGWVPQSALLFPHLTVRKNLAYAGAEAGEVARVAKMLEVESLLDRKPKRLSGGEKQRVALGRALLTDAAGFLLDEPFTGLDPELLLRLAPRVLSEIGDRILVLVTHDPTPQELLTEEKWRLSVDPENPSRRLLLRD